MRVADIMPADVHRWRDSFAGSREGQFNRSVPVLAALLKYAEALRPGAGAPIPAGDAALQARTQRAIPVAR
jgi:hypothetical protein